MAHQSNGILSVLLVDDDQELRDTLDEYLQDEGFAITSCGTRQQALEAIGDRRNHFHIILTDLLLPDGNGLDVIETAKQKDPRVLAVIMTGYASLDTALKAMRVGAYDYLTKPFSIDEIEILLRNMTDRIRLMEENKQSHQRLHELYSKLDFLKEEKIELMRAHREMKLEFEKVYVKLDQMAELLRHLGNSCPPALRG